VSDPSAVLSPEARAALRTVLEHLAADRASLSSVVDERAWHVHVEDSLTGLEVPELPEARRIADIGAGAGFPGLALAAARPEAQIDLIESVSRKCDFMRRASGAAGITNVTILDARSEDLATAEEHREACDVVTARAVGRLSSLAELASPLLRDGGVLVAWKGKRDAEEEAELERAEGALAMVAEGVLDVGDRAGSRFRHLHVIRKVGATPGDLPRRAGVAKKRPKGRI
jgi:16S rRNA (guanine527-N7)-methyltransferase